jgi:hypothetical protein
MIRKMLSIFKKQPESMTYDKFMCLAKPNGVVDNKLCYEYFVEENDECVEYITLLSIYKNSSQEYNLWFLVGGISVELSRHFHLKQSNSIEEIENQKRKEANKMFALMSKIKGAE